MAYTRALFVLALTSLMAAKVSGKLFLTCVSYTTYMYFRLQICDCYIVCWLLAAFCNGANDWLCSSRHQCIFSTYVCDGNYECLDGSDEFGCSRTDGRYVRKLTI